MSNEYFVEEELVEEDVEGVEALIMITKYFVINYDK